MSTYMPEGRPNATLSTRETRRFLSDYVRKRVGVQDVDDVVQTVLVDALAAQRIPEVDSELRRWLIGIARHKIADHHRKAGREQPAELPDLEASAPPLEERQMATWAERQAPASKEAARTLEWMAREGEGEKLEQIAIDEQVAAATVRQRVSRMRRWMRERWLAELAAVAALGLLAFALWRWLQAPPLPVTREPSPAIDDKDTNDLEKGPPQKVAPSPLDRARDLRRAAGEDCSRNDYAPCLQKLDEARDLDPAGDRTPEVQDMRAGANAGQRDEGSKQQKKSNDSDSFGDEKEKDEPTPRPTATPPKPPPPNPKTGPTKKDATPSKPTKASSVDTPSGIDSAIVLGDSKTQAPPPPQVAPRNQAPQPQAAPQQAALPEHLQQQQAFTGKK